MLGYTVKRVTLISLISMSIRNIVTNGLVGRADGGIGVVKGQATDSSEGVAAAGAERLIRKDFAPLLSSEEKTETKDLLST